MIYGVGETVLDILFRDSEPQKAVPGGSTFNALISLGRRGMDCAMITEVGDDRVGQITRDYLTANGVSDKFVKTNPGMKSHISLAFLNERNDAEYTFYKDHNAWQPDTEHLPDFTADDVLILSSYYAINPVTEQIVTSLLHRAKEAGAYIYYDVNFRRPHVQDLPKVKDAILRNIEMSSVVRASHEDIEYIGFTPAHEHLIITRGAREVTYHGVTYPVASIETVSTIGAGDTFNAGFIYGHLMHMSDEEKISTAIEWAQQVCRKLENSL